MKKTLLVSALVIAAASASAQVCVPNPLYADSVFGVWPDTVTNFMAGMVDVAYSQTLDLLVPQNAGDVNPDFEGVMLDSVVFAGITGLPPGLSVGCASQTPANCTYLTGQLGCGIITGVPTTAGVYPLTLNVTAYAALFGSVLPIDQSFTGYSITIEENSVGIADLNLVGLGGVRNVPNPFSTRTVVEFQLGAAAPVQVSVFNLLGVEVFAQEVQGKPGVNKVPFEAGILPDGVYLYRLQSGKDTFTGRMSLNR